MMSSHPRSETPPVGGQRVKKRPTFWGRSELAKQRRRLTKEFKLEAVQLARESERSVARDLGIARSMLHRWMQQVEAGDPTTAFAGNGHATGPAAEVRQLRRELERVKQERDWYAAAGLHDANGSPTEVGPNSFFKVRQYYSWVEAGWNPAPNPLDGEGVHVNLWRQDAREQEGTEDTWGVTFSASKVFDTRRRWMPFVRMGYSEADGGQLVRVMIAGGLGATVRGSDLFALATSWSGPVDQTLRNQVTSEVLYRLQLMENLAVTPNIQFTINPSQTLETDTLWVIAVLRLRLAL